MSFVKRMPSTETKCWLPSETLIAVKEKHLQSALSPIVVTLFGMVMEVKEEHSENASFPIVVIPSEMMTVASFLLISFGLIFISPVPVSVSDVKEGHSENAPCPIVVTLFGMEMEVKEEHL